MAGRGLRGAHASVHVKMGTAVQAWDAGQGCLLHQAAWLCCDTMLCHGALLLKNRLFFLSVVLVCTALSALRACPTCPCLTVRLSLLRRLPMQAQRPSSCKTPPPAGCRGSRSS